MPNHALVRNDTNEAVCACGFRPTVLDAAAPVGRNWKAQNEVWNHIDALAKATKVDAPFRGHVDAFPYPRAGIRRGVDGRWVITLWDRAGVVHAWESDGMDKHDTRLAAFEFAHLFIGAHRRSGTRLNGMPAAA